jgi:hypothetical protein
LVRLALLAFMTTTFKDPGRNISYGWLAARIEVAYMKSNIGWLPEQYSLHVWTLMAASFIVTGTSERWIRRAWRGANQDSLWLDVKSHLSRIFWVELIHDRAGESAFRQLGHGTCDEVVVQRHFWS